MDKKRSEIIITAILVVILIFVFTKSLKRVRPKFQAQKQQIKAGAAPLPGVEPLFKIRKEEKMAGVIEGQLAWGRDPFTLEEVSQGGVESIAGLKLMGITVWERTRPMAIINDEIMSVGSRIGKFTVIKILPDKVVVTDGEENFELRMKK